MSKFEQDANSQKSKVNLNPLKNVFKRAHIYFARLQEK